MDKTTTNRSFLAHPLFCSIILLMRAGGEKISFPLKSVVQTSLSNLFYYGMTIFYLLILSIYSIYWHRGHAVEAVIPDIKLNELAVWGDFSNFFTSVWDQPQPSTLNNLSRLALFSVYKSNNAWETRPGDQTLPLNLLDDHMFK